MTPGAGADWRVWLDGLPDSTFPLTPQSLLQWLRLNNRVPPLFWDQFRTRLMTELAGEEWEDRSQLFQALERVQWGF